MVRSKLGKRLGSLALASALAAAASAEVPIGTVSVSIPGGRVAVGSVHVGPLWAVALAQAADSVTLENVQVEVEGSTYRIPRAALSGTGLSSSDLGAIFDARSAEPWSTRLARLTAGSITIPEFTVEQNLGSVRQITTYRDVLAQDVAAGRVGKATAAGASVRTSGAPGGDQAGRYNRVSVENFDLAEAARIFVEHGTVDPGPLKTVYDTFLIEGITLEGPDGSGAGVRIARLETQRLQARPTRGSWIEILKAIGSGQKWADLPAEQRSHLLATAADLFDAFTVDSLELTGLVSTSPGPKDPVTFAVGRIAYSGARGSDQPGIRFDDIAVTAPDGRSRIASFSLAGFSSQTAIDALRSLAQAPPASVNDVEFRKLFPIAGTVRLAGLDLDVPDKDAQPPADQRLRFGVREMEIAASRPFQGLPTDLRLGLTGLTLAVSPNSSQEGFRQLAGMGYREIDLSATTSATWNEPGSELVLREVSLTGKDMGRATLRGVLGGVTKDAFSFDNTVAMVAMIGATAKTADLTVENNGLFDRILAQKAAEQKKSPDELRRDYGVTAAVGVPPMLGNSGAAKAIGQAVARFVAKPGRLSISARAKDPAGLGIADVVGLREPGAVLDRLEVRAGAE